MTSSTPPSGDNPTTPDSTTSAGATSGLTALKSAVVPVLSSLKTTASKTAFTVFMTGYKAWAKKNQAMPEENLSHECFAMTVTAVEDIAPCLRRITCTAPNFASFSPSGADEYFGLVIPPKGRDLVLPEGGDANIRASLMEIPEDDRPVMRWYTIRRLDKKSATMVFDVVTHGHSGPGSSWALDARPGVTVGYRAVGATYSPLGVSQLLVADPTSLPAVHAIVEQMDEQTLSQCTIVAVIPSNDVVESTLDDYRGRVKELAVLTASVDDAPQVVRSWLEDRGAFVPDYSWICGEASLVKEIRRLLVKDWGVEKTTVLFSGYWRKDKAHHS